MSLVTAIIGKIQGEDQAQREQDWNDYRILLRGSSKNPQHDADAQKLKDVMGRFGIAGKTDMDAHRFRALLSRLGITPQQVQTDLSILAEFDELCAKIEQGQGCETLSAEQREKRRVFSEEMQQKRRDMEETRRQMDNEENVLNGRFSNAQTAVKQAEKIVAENAKVLANVTIPTLRP